jgi:hypothetical protein
MGEDFEDSVDTSSFDDISTDTTDTSSFSDPVDVGDMMDDIPAEPLESFDVEPLDSSFETELPTAEATDIDSLMDGAADTYMTEEVPSDTLDSSGLDPSDLSSDIDDYEMDAGSDIADLMDEAAIESFDEVAMDTTEVNDSTDNDIETLMNDVELVSDTAENPSEIEMDTIENDDDNINEVESLLATEELSQDDASDLVEELDSDNTEEMQEATDVSALMDESDVGDTIPLVDESIEDTSDDFETEDVPPVETDMEENEIGTEEISEGTEPLDSTQIDADTETNSSVTDISEDEQGELEGALSDVSDTQPGSPLDAEVSAYDQLADYYNSHNYGQQDYAEYSKDPEWQELNNAYLQELSREPIDYSGGETSDITDIRDELIAAGIPENSPELDAILANEQEGIENIQDLDSPAESSIDGETDATYDEPPLDNSEPQITDSEIDEEVESNPQTGSEDISSDITSDEQLDVASDLPVMTPREYDDFEQSVLEGKPDFYESGSFYEQGINEFGYQGTCGPTSQANALNELFDTNEFTENKVLNVAVDNNLCSMDSSPENCGGTTTEQFMELYDKMNEQLDGKINTELYEFNNALDVEDVASKLDEGCVLNVAVDADALWDQPREYVNSMGIPCDDFYSDHWITVTGVQRDELGNIQGFDIIDSGGGVNYVDADKYHEMCFGTDEHRVIDPTAIVVSKNDVPIASDANHDTGDNSNTGDQSNWFQRIFGRRNE